MGSPWDAKMASVPAPSSKAFSREAFAVLKIYTSMNTIRKNEIQGKYQAEFLYDTNKMLGQRQILKEILRLNMLCINQIFFAPGIDFS